MASAAPAARVGDSFGHSSAMNGVMIGLAVGALIGTAILTGGVSLIAVGAAVAVTGGAGLAGQAIGQTMEGPDTGTITIGSPNVFIEGQPAAMTVLATGVCSKDSGGPIPVATGSRTVHIHTQAAARVGEKMGCSAVIRRGARSVFIGGPSETVIQPTPEVPVVLENIMLAMVIGGTAIGTLGVGLTYGAGAAVGSLVGGTVGGHLGGQAASAGAAALGYGATGQAIAGVAGGALGGALGGAGGFRGGAAGQARLRPPIETPPPKTPSQQAQQWQGPGNRDYPGVDKYRDITLKPGTKIVAGEPGQGNYYTTKRGFSRSGASQEKLWRGLQVKKHPDYPMRSAVREYEVMEPTPAAFGIVKANPQYGEGGLPQLYIPDFSKLRPLDVTPLSIP